MQRLIVVDDDTDFLKSFEETYSDVFKIGSYSSPSDVLGWDEIPKDIDAILIDLLMPEIDGISFIARLKEKSPSLPALIVLTHSNTKESRVAAFEKLVGDFLSKELESSEIIARIKAAIARSKSPIHFRDNGLEFDVDSLNFYLNGKELVLTKIETKVLYNILVTRSPPVPRSEILSAVWPEKPTTLQTLNTHLFNINLKLQDWSKTLSVDNVGLIQLVD